MLLVPSCGRILKLVWLLIILQCIRPVVGCRPFVFLKEILQLNFMLSPLPTDHDLLSVNVP